MPEDIVNQNENQDLSNLDEAEASIDPSLKEEEERKSRLEMQREQELLRSADSFNRDTSELTDEKETLEPELIMEDGEIKVKNFGGEAGTFSFSDDEFDKNLLEDGTIAKSLKDNSENKYLISRNAEENVIEYDFSDFDVGALNKESQLMAYERREAGEFVFEVEFNVDKDGTINIESVRGDAEGRINFKDSDGNNLTLDADGKLVEITDEK